MQQPEISIHPLIGRLRQKPHKHGIFLLKIKYLLKVYGKIELTRN